jgi:hypothetical protein
MHGSRESPIFHAPTLWNGSQLWDTYCNTHANVDTIMWNVFMAHFHTHYVPRGTVNLKKKEFADLKQESMTVNVYLNSFTQLSRHAPYDINIDEKK